MALATRRAGQWGMMEETRCGVFGSRFGAVKLVEAFLHDE
jgi:hypothetical protein